MFILLLSNKNYQEGELTQTENKKANDCYRNILLLKLIKTTRLFNNYRLVTSTEVTKLVIYRGPVGPEVNNQLNNQPSFNMQGN